MGCVKIPTKDLFYLHCVCGVILFTLGSPYLLYCVCPSCQPLTRHKSGSCHLNSHSQPPGWGSGNSWKKLPCQLESLPLTTSAALPFSSPVHLFLEHWSTDNRAQTCLSAILWRETSWPLMLLWMMGLYHSVQLLPEMSVITSLSLSCHSDLIINVSPAEQLGRTVVGG